MSDQSSDFTRVSYREATSGRFIRSGTLRLHSQGAAFTANSEVRGDTPNTVTVGLLSIVRIDLVSSGPLGPQNRYGRMLEFRTHAGDIHQFHGLNSNDDAAINKFAEATGKEFVTRQMCWSGQTWGTAAVDGARLVFAAQHHPTWNDSEILELPLRPVKVVEVSACEVRLQSSPPVTGGARIVGASFVATTPETAKNLSRGLERAAQIGGRPVVVLPGVECRTPNSGLFDVAITPHALRLTREGSEDEIILPYGEIKGIYRFTDDVESRIARDSTDRAIANDETIVPLDVVAIHRSSSKGEPFVVFSFPTNAAPAQLPVYSKFQVNHTDVLAAAGLSVSRIEEDAEDAAERGLTVDTLAGAVEEDAQISYNVVTALPAACLVRLLRAVVPSITPITVSPEQTLSIPAANRSNFGTLHFMPNFAIYIGKSSMLINYRDIEKATTLEKKNGEGKKVFTLNFTLIPAATRPRQSILLGKGKLTTIEFSKIPSSILKACLTNADGEIQKTYTSCIDDVTAVLRKHSIEVASTAASTSGTADIADIDVEDVEDDEDDEFDVNDVEDSDVELDREFEEKEGDASGSVAPEEDEDEEEETAGAARPAPRTRARRSPPASAPASVNMMGLEFL